MSNDPLLQPFRLRHLALRNRLLSTSHEPAYSEDGMPKGRYRRYHVEKAKGGIGLTQIGGSAIVAPDSPPAFGNLHLHDDAIVPWLRELSDEVHAHGAAVMCQITHLGRRTGWNTGDWLPVVAPSLRREPAHRAFPKVLEDWDIARIITHYADAAERCVAGGLDGIEIEAYGHLVDQFWSPATNAREDEWGGDLDNRLRFANAVIAAIRERVGADALLGMRMVLDEDMKHGFGRETGLEIARRLTSDGSLDFLSVIKGHIDTDEGVSRVIPIMGTPAAPHLGFAGEVKAAIGLPVFHAARINDVATARHAVAEGLLDMVGMTRAHLADPHIGVKLARHEEHRIRPCVGIGYCVDRLYEGRDALCAHNAATGREGLIPHEITERTGEPQRVVVVGAGPAGLEAARVCAARGHEVVVLEAADEPGGQIRIGAAVKRRRELLGIIDWRLSELSAAGVEVQCNIFAEPEDVLALAPGIVIVATGGIPNTSFLEDGEDLVTSGWDILTGSAPAGQEVLLFDDNGAHPGMAAAEALCAAGSTLEFITPERTLAPDVGGLNYPAYCEVFERHGVRITLNQRLEAVRRDGNRLEAVLFNEYARTHSRRTVDQVVVEHGTLPADELYFALRPGSSNGGAVDQSALIAGRAQTLRSNSDGAYRLFRIGDAVASRNIHAAIYDAIRLCMAL